MRRFLANANVTLKGHLGVVTSNSATASATATLSDGAAHAGGDALVKVMASATDSGEIGPVLGEWRRGGYRRFGLGSRDVLRDLVQDLRQNPAPIG